MAEAIRSLRRSQALPAEPGGSANAKKPAAILVIDLAICAVKLIADVVKKRGHSPVASPIFWEKALLAMSESMAAPMLTRLVGRKGPEGATPVDNLTDRELQVLELIGKGLGTRQIAEKLHLSVKTVENHREHIKAKLKLRTSAELVRYAVRWELESS